MENKVETNPARRTFLRDLARAAGGVTAAFSAAPAVLARRNPNSRLGVGCIGVGTRGHYLLERAQNIPNTEVRTICDLYQGHVKRAQGICTNPKVRIIREWEKVVQDPDIDAVIIATPDFWHTPMTIGAAEAKKDIYVEKGWCRRLDEAKQMRKAIKENKVVMQLGHGNNSKPTFHRAREIYRSGQLGKVPLVRMYCDRTGKFPMWKFYGNYRTYEMPKDAGPDTIDWERFIANAPRRPFDAERFFTWRCWWDYGTGIAGDLMSHLWDGVNMIMKMGIPESAQTQGATYFWKADRDVPDMWHVVFDYPKQDLAITFGCSFHNKCEGQITKILGREKTLEVDLEFCRTYSAEWKPEYADKRAKAQKTAEEAGLRSRDAVVPPDYSMAPDELKVSTHMEDFFECVRTRRLPRCHVDRAFEEAVAIVMSVESYWKERKVHWDPVNEEIV